MKQKIFVASLAALLASQAMPLVTYAKEDAQEPEIQGTLKVDGKSEKEFPSLVKLSLQDAIKRATEKSPGKVLETALENENGYLVYAIEVATANQGVKEITVDAVSGKILAMQEESDDEKGEGAEHDDDEGESDND